MAITENRVPPPAPLPEGFIPRVVLKFKSDVQLPYSRAAENELAKYSGVTWNELSRNFDGIALVPYFSTIAEPTLLELMRRAPRTERSMVPPNFRAYYAIECPAGVDPHQVVKAVAQWPNVDITYVEGGPVAPPLDPSDDPRSGNQRYLDAAPGGIDARWAWTNTQTDGSSLGFVDLERGWTLNHEDLAAANITVISGLSRDYHGHGTAVLGEVVAVDNTRGGIGIAPHAHARVVSQWRTASTYNTAEAILSAVSVMQAGDVLLLEAQTNYAGYANVPVEVEQAVFDAIEFATAQGIVVIEAGGNGAVDLDTFTDVNGKMILNRNSAEFRDSGATLVGAASSAAPHQRLSFSNYGSRIDCFGWGQDIDTAGDGWTGTGTSTYTTGFGGTSGASPIVTGAALLLQSWRVGHGKPRYAPSALRDVLGDVKLNTASANPSLDRIGVMPDLHAIIQRENRFRWTIYLAWAWMIVIGALLVTPGGTLCIKCGPLDPGYIGDPLVNVLGLATIVLGIIGLAGLVSRGAGSSLSARR